MDSIVSTFIVFLAVISTLIFFIHWIWQSDTDNAYPVAANHNNKVYEFDHAEFQKIVDSRIVYSIPFDSREEKLEVMTIWTQVTGENVNHYWKYRFFLNIARNTLLRRYQLTWWSTRPCTVAFQGLPKISHFVLIFSRLPSACYLYFIQQFNLKEVSSMNLSSNS